MADFMMRFFISNLFIGGIVVILLTAKRILINTLSSRMQYHLWFLLLGLLAVPFLPSHFIGLFQMFPWLLGLTHSHTSNAKTAAEAVGTATAETVNWIHDFTLSVNSKAPSVTGYILFGIWMAGILGMMIVVSKSALRLRALKKSALPLQNPRVRDIYHHCLEEIGITANIPVYSTAFLKSPVIVGFLKPRIYLPIPLILDDKELDMKYMLLHELQHYKHKDIVISYLMSLAGILYWFNPLVWYALREMRSDREVACDTSVLEMLSADSYVDYGNTLIHIAKIVSLNPFPFAAGIGGSYKQMKRRIINISNYKNPSFRKKMKGLAAFMLTAILLISLAPVLSTYAADAAYYQWQPSSRDISYEDLSAYFGEYEGSFVLYASETDSWRIHNAENAALRVAPNSTYKIYDALFGLEESIITPFYSVVPWDGKTYPFEAWNADQTLRSAMSSSVNWYFQAIDERLGAAGVYDYIHQIGYGNENTRGELSTYWLESSLAISPIEQVELLIKLNNNSFGFSSENIGAVKNAIRLTSSDAGTLYGKTGTGRVDNQDVNGWFVGCIETPDNTYYFATNITADQDAAGSNAAELTMSILADMNIW